MTEVKLPIEVKGAFKNIRLKTLYKTNPDKSPVLDENNQKIVVAQGLEDGDHIIVTKNDKFLDGREIKMPTYTMYSCSVTYNDEKVSFLVYSEEHEEFKNCGGLGDKVKISLKKGIQINRKTGLEMIVAKLIFEKVD